MEDALLGMNLDVQSDADSQGDDKCDSFLTELPS